MAKAVILVATLTVRPESLAEFQEVVADLASATRIEEGNIDYEMHRSNDDMHEFVMIEHWRSQKDLDDHLAQSYTKAAFSRFRDLLRGDPRLQLLTCLTGDQPAR
ncbi:putative quinol monooxygenase [Rhizobium leguminosarum]|uniref:putative quinol monooxygenase n=1 Tax=Rhizobium TaxID=379 RepID=UPI0013EE9F27|nr:putative quinol monooxygenase [Rhizobium leguminosarum]